MLFRSKDLKYFLKTLGGIEYCHQPELAPTQDILDQFKKKKGEWTDYETRFLDLMAQRKIDERLDPSIFEDGCLLCSEARPHHCHRRLVVEYLKDRWRVPLDIKHL